MDIIMGTIAIGEIYQQIVEPGLFTKRVYCKKHNYDFIVQTECLGEERPPAWYKIPFLQNLFSNGHECVFMSDGDVLITNNSIQLQDLASISDKDMLVSADCDSVIANTGNFLMRNTEWSREFLKLWWTKTEFINHNYWEQQAFIDCWEKNEFEVREHVVICDQRLFNSFYKPMPLPEHMAWQVGDFIMHISGPPRELLGVTMREQYQRVFGVPYE
jgi:mannan polymerase II complex MNN10 subunit